MVKLNKKKLHKLGFKFENKKELFDFVNKTMSFLESHNKNYTKDQYYLISVVRDILSCFETIE
ncbi:MAG: hypothetical protein NC124_02490 [Clostridium sp.]|nr:hypothetical protein [Clostridium sp.]